MSAVIWHDVECGSYEADLALWRELADAGAGPVLELGAGSGRVALHLAGQGHDVVALERDEELASELERRAAREGASLEVIRGDAAGFELGRRFAVILAPMQLIQLLPGQPARGECLRAIRGHLDHGGRAALALVGEAADGVAPPELMPDMRELDGIVYSSRPLRQHNEDGALLIERLRQRVSPQGELEDELSEVRLQTLRAAELECESEAAGLRPLQRRRIEPTPDHLGSDVVILEA